MNKFDIMMLSMIFGAIVFIVLDMALNGFERTKNNPTPIICYSEKDGIVRKDNYFDNIEYSFISDTIYVCDEWKADSDRVKKEIFEATMNIHACDNVLSTIKDLPNLEYYIEKVEYDKSLYQATLDSLKSEEIKIKNDTLRKNDRSIDFIKTTIKIKDSRK